MLVRNRDVSHLPVDGVIRLITSDSFPSPFVNGLPSFGEVSDRNVAFPDNDKEIRTFLSHCTGKLTSPKLEKLLRFKTEIETEYRTLTERINETARTSQDVDHYPGGYLDRLMEINKALGNHFFAIGEKQKASEYYLEVINLYDQGLYNSPEKVHVLNDRAAIIEEGYRGISKDSPIGTTNIQSCIACVVEGSDGTVQVVHFNEGADIAKTLHDIRKEMPGPYTITPIGAGLPTNPTLPSSERYLNDIAETSQQNVNNLITAFKDEPDIRINAAWLLKRMPHIVTAIVVDPKSGIRVEQPNNHHPNEIIEKALTTVRIVPHEIALSFDMRKSSKLKPVLLTSNAIERHQENMRVLGGLDFVRKTAREMSPTFRTYGPPYHQYYLMGKLELAHLAAIKTVAHELEKAVQPLIQSCTRIEIDGMPVTAEAAMARLQQAVQELPKFVGEGQEELNRQLVKDMVTHRGIFQTDGTGNLTIDMRKLNTVVEALARNIAENSISIPQHLRR